MIAKVKCPKLSKPRSVAPSIDTCIQSARRDVILVLSATTFCDGDETLVVVGCVKGFSFQGKTFFQAASQGQKTSILKIDDFDLGKYFWQKLNRLPTIFGTNIGI